MQSQPKEEDNVCSDHSQTDLYDRYGKVIFGYLRLHAPSLEDAEDLLLEVFLAALEKDNLPTLSSDEQLAWLRQVAHNKLFNVYRRARRRPQVSLHALEETILEEEEEGPEQLALQQEEHLQLQVHLKQLSALQQQVLQLRYGDGLRCTEIALLLNKREGTVRQLLSRTIHFLRRVYHHQEGESTC